MRCLLVWVYEEQWEGVERIGVDNYKGIVNEYQKNV